MLSGVDVAILYFFNRSVANPVFDWFFKTISENWFLLGFLAIISIVLIWKDRRHGLVVAIIVLIGLACSDIICTYILKKLICRLRPCHSLTDLRTIAGCGGLYGFPSNHAANSVAVVFLLTRFYRRLSPYLWTLVTLVCISRIYLGKHYPTDIIGGVIAGVLIAAAILLLGKRFFSQENTGVGLIPKDN